jgi:general secretion pathway protein K
MNIKERSLSPIRDSKGSVLILSFWVLSFLSFFAVAMGATSRMKLTLADRLIERAELRLIAEAGVRRAAAELKKQEPGDHPNSLLESWANNEGVFKDAKVGKGVFNVKYEYADDNGEGVKTRFGIVDEERKININLASLDVLQRLFKTVLGWDDRQAGELASAIIDWRDMDTTSLAQGAEDNYYMGLKYPYECKDGPFNIPDELLLVRGVTATIYKDLLDYATIYGNGAVNVNTAPRAVLIALGIQEKVVDEIVAFRRGKDLIEATQDDNVFADTGAIVPQLSQFTALDPIEVENLSNVVSAGLLGTVSENFRVTSFSGYDYKKGEARVACVFQKTLLDAGEIQYRIVYWRTYI